MQLFFKQVGGGGGWVLLYDQSSNPPYSGFDKVSAPSAWPKFEPEFTSVGQEDQLFTTPDPSGDTPVSQFRQPLSNVVAQVPVVLESAYETNDAAMASIATFASLLEMKVHYQVVVGATTHYYPNATTLRYKGVPMGRAVTHSFTFRSDKVTTQAPA